jgi:5-hydroxyisourate hydrolase
MSGGISIHAVDVVSGRPAVGMKVVLRRLHPDPQLIVDGVVAADGTLPGSHVVGADIRAGTYEVVFSFAQFYGKTPCFLEEVPFRFNVTSGNEHVHLPIKFSPWGFSLFRGA